MSVENIKEQAMRYLGVNESEVDYITEDYLEKMSMAIEEDESELEFIRGNNKSVAKKGVYCNSYSAGTDLLRGWMFYYRGEIGTPGYGCKKTLFRKMKIKYGCDIHDMGFCPDGNTRLYFVCEGQ